MYNTKTVTINKDLFEHLLNCVVKQNQQVLDEVYQKAECFSREQCKNEESQQKCVIVNNLSKGTKETLQWSIGNIAIKDIANFSHGSIRNLEIIMQELIQVSKELQ